MRDDDRIARALVRLQAGALTVTVLLILDVLVRW